MMMRDARAGRFNLLLVSSVDRLAPSAVHTMGIVECLLDYGVSFKSLSGEFDLEGEPGKVSAGTRRALCENDCPQETEAFSVSGIGTNRVWTATRRLEERTTMRTNESTGSNGHAQTIRVAIYARVPADGDFSELGTQIAGVGGAHGGGA